MKKAFPIIVFVCLAGLSVCGQYYYNDQVITGELMKKRNLYQLNNVKAVQYNSFDNNNQPIDGFSCSQSVNSDFTVISTVTTTTLSGKSESSSFFNTKGQLIKSIDTSDGNSITNEYKYDNGGRIINILSKSISTGQFKMQEQHQWFYNQDGNPEKMWKIKNDADTTFISFVLDANGNVIEEKSLRNGQALPDVLYYYDNNNRLTDIVRYNRKAKRLLPDYIFEYNEAGLVKSMLVVPEGSNEYQKWYYTYTDKGLKSKDECFSKSKMLIGRIEYRYSY